MAAGWRGRPCSGEDTTCCCSGGAGSHGPQGEVPLAATASAGKEELGELESCGCRAPCVEHLLLDLWPA